MSSSKLALYSTKFITSSLFISPTLRAKAFNASQIRNISGKLFSSNGFLRVNAKTVQLQVIPKRNFSTETPKKNESEGSSLIKNLPKFSNSEFNSSYLIGGVAAVLGVILLANSITVIPAGHIGLLDLFGNVSERTLPSGLHLKNPLAKVRKFSLQTQIEQANTEVPSKEGLLIMLECALQYHLNANQVRELYINVGKNYADKLLRPQFWSTIRQITSSYDAKALYNSESRARMSVEIREHLNAILLPRGIIVEDAPLKKIVLPQKLASAIEHKLSAEQESQRMEFILQKEELEAQRKAIEAKGISQFQKIVSEGVSEPLLRWKGIEATERLAESPNAKIIVIGGKDGLPIILNPKDK